MEYVGYKKIHKHNTRNTKVTVVEWPGGGFTLNVMGRVSKDTWSGAGISLTNATARRIRSILNGIFERKVRR